MEKTVEEDLPEGIEYDIFVRVQPVKEQAIRVKIKDIKKAVPKNVEPKGVLEFHKVMVAAEIISSSNEDYVITDNEALKFIQMLENPNPERVKTRQKTLQKAIDVFEKHSKE